MHKAKSEIRKCILEKRKKLPVEAIKDKSNRILHGLNLLQSFQNARLVMCYMDFRNEVNTSEIIINCLKQGKRVALPYCTVSAAGKCNLEVYEINDINYDVCPGKYGISEPVREKLLKAAPEDIDVVLVPGIVFDLNRFRIGYGAGYYDGFLGKVKPECFKAGLAYDFQIIDEVPAEEHDMQMDVVVTESRIIY